MVDAVGTLAGRQREGDAIRGGGTMDVRSTPEGAKGTKNHKVAEGHHHILVNCVAVACPGEINTRPAAWAAVFLLWGWRTRLSANQRQHRIGSW